MRLWSKPLRFWIFASFLFSLGLHHGGTLVSAYHKGDTLHLARKAQYRQLRTEWHEVFGRFSPHFGVDGMVALPIPKPQDFEKGDDYKLSFALDHYTFHSPWMRIIDGKKKSISIPMIQVDMVLAGEELTSFRAKVVPLPKEYSSAHMESINHFRNDTHWPKLLVVKYNWKEKDLVKVELGILVVTAIGVLVGTYLMLKIIAGSGELSAFMHEVSENNHVQEKTQGMPQQKGE
jgi:hypothetical protein